MFKPMSVIAPLPWRVFIVNQLLWSVYTNPWEKNPCTCTVRFATLNSCAVPIWATHSQSTAKVHRGIVFLQRSSVTEIDGTGLNLRRERLD